MIKTNSEGRWFTTQLSKDRYLSVATIAELPGPFQDFNVSACDFKNPGSGREDDAYYKR